MIKPIKWELDLFIDDNEQYIKLITYLGESNLYTFEAEPMFMLEHNTTHRILISCVWTNNLKPLAKWIDKNISDAVF